MELTLSILVISHNQKELLRRCITSLLQQQLSCPYEIIISDDRSTDGTWELIEAYQQQYPDLIFGYHCNSDECHPANRSERCGWNKANAYRHAKGKYFVNIDADDYLKSNDIYQLQVDALEAHPECSMCQQQIWTVNDGEELETGRAWPISPLITSGNILTPTDIILKGLRALNQGYMMRRNPTVDPIELYGKHFDDTVITLHHLQYGNVVVVERADYVWVQYASSINSSLKNMDRDVVIGLLPIHHILFIPTFAGLFIKDGLPELVDLFYQSSQRTMNLTPETRNFLNEFKGFVFRYYTKSNLSLWYKWRMLIVRYLVLFIKKYKLDYTWAYQLLFAMMVDAKSAHKITKEQWKINP